jgi:hypothetical protein
MTTSVSCCTGIVGEPPQSHFFGQEPSATMPDHKVKISISRERRPWWRTWNDYPNPTRDALLALFGIAMVVMVFWFLLMK